jgi:hypothetical protein
MIGMRQNFAYGIIEVVCGVARAANHKEVVLNNIGERKLLCRK